jgi:hypothetical protein
MTPTVEKTSKILRPKTNAAAPALVIGLGSPGNIQPISSRMQSPSLTSHRYLPPAGLFVQNLRLSLEAGLIKLSHAALDGKKAKANTSKHKAMNYGRMKKKKRGA